MGFAACLAISLTMYFVRERRERSAFICRLLPAQREGLRGFESNQGGLARVRGLAGTWSPADVSAQEMTTSKYAQERPSPPAGLLAAT